MGRTSRYNDVMVQPLFDLALKLPREERWQLVGELIDSLAGDAEAPIDEAQRAELERRIADYRANPSIGRPWREVVGELRQRA